MSIEYAGYVNGDRVTGILLNLAATTTIEELISILEEMAICGPHEFWNRIYAS